VARVDYWKIEQEIAEIIRTQVPNVFVTVERELLFGMETAPWIGVYLDRRDAPPELQSLSAGTRTRFRLRFMVLVWCFSLEYERSFEERDEVLSKVEVALMGHRTLNELVKSSWLEGGDMSTRVPPERSGFLAGGEIILIADAQAST